MFLKREDKIIRIAVPEYLETHGRVSADLQKSKLKLRHSADQPIGVVTKRIKKILAELLDERRRPMVVEIVYDNILEAL